MSRLFRDATKANAAGLTAVREESKRPTYDEGFDDFETGDKPTVRQQAQSPQQNEGHAATNQTLVKPVYSALRDEAFDARGFAKDFFNQLEGFGSLRTLLPADIASFADLDRFKQTCAGDLRVEMRLELNRLAEETAEAFRQLRKAERAAESAVASGSERAAVIPLLFDRKDLQHKVALLTRKKITLLAAQESLNMFEMFAEFSRDFSAFQVVSQRAASDAKAYLPEDAVDTDVRLSLAFDSAKLAAHDFKFDKEAIHDYAIIDITPANQAAIRADIDLEYRSLLALHSRAPN